MKKYLFVPAIVSIATIVLGVPGVLGLLGVLVPRSAGAATLTVGMGKTYAKPCAAIAAAQPGDFIEVDAGKYDGDHCAWSTDNLTVRGVGAGRASIDAGGLVANIAQDKGIFTIAANNATIENFEFSGAVADPGSKNGAGIRHQGLNLTVRNCYFHNNEDGILGGPPTGGTGEVLIERSEFFHNGNGDGYSHNMYIGHYAKFTIRRSYTHSSKVGHLIKSRANENHILYNRITDEADGTGSYEIDLPNGGLSFIVGNLVEQGPLTQNPSIVDYAEEGGSNPDQHLYLINNTIVNDYSKGTFVNLAMANPPAVLTNNLFIGPGTIVSQMSALQKTNYEAPKMGDPKLADVANLDFHLALGSPCIDAGSDPGMGSGQSLAPDTQYVHPASGEPRVTSGQSIDIGAYEFGAALLPMDAAMAGDAHAGSDANVGAAPQPGCSCSLSRPRTPAGFAHVALGIFFALLLTRFARRRA